MVFATASITVEATKTQINAEEELTVNVSLSINASDNTIYYLRGVFYKLGTTRYCGHTWDGNEWFSGPYSSNEG
ncbi:hypothetical protein KKG52_02895 [Patescibacteria group bacterium]|nr:hypothetical protein [Patescibacteria group bacterium]